MNKLTLKAEPRVINGRKVKTLRRGGFVPGVIYGRGLQSLSVQVPVKDFERAYAAAGESTLIYLDVNGEQYPSIIHDIDRHPVSDLIRHADFYKVSLTEKIHAKIPLHFVGEAPAVKELAGILVKNMNEVEVEGLPQDLPYAIEVAISKLVKFNDQILVSDLPLPKGITIKAQAEEIVALVQEPISEAELEAQLAAPTATAEDVEVIKRPSAEVELGVEPDENKPATPASPEEKKKN